MGWGGGLGGRGACSIVCGEGWGGGWGGQVSSPLTAQIEGRLQRAWEWDAQPQQLLLLLAGTTLTGGERRRLKHGVSAGRL